MNEERWLPVVGFEGLYEVSDLGRVKSVARKTTSGSSLRTRILRAELQPGHRALVTLRKDSSGHHLSVAVIVLTAFVGARPPGAWAVCLDGNQGHTALSNLAWKPAWEEHVERKRRNQTLPVGEKHTNYKLSEGKIAEAKSRIAAGESYRVVAKDFGISTGALWNRIHRQARRLAA